jgi:hypothetical protein
VDAGFSQNRALQLFESLLLEISRFGAARLFRATIERFI